MPNPTKRQQKRNRKRSMRSIAQTIQRIHTIAAQFRVKRIDVVKEIDTGRVQLYAVIGVDK